MQITNARLSFLAGLFLALPGAATLADDLATDVNARKPDGSTPLQWAVYEDDADEVRRLLAAGADVALANRYGASPMSLAAEVADTEILRLLLDAGADVDSPNPEGQTALMAVARTGNLEAANLLLDRGARVDARESWGGQTALMWASARRHPPMMELLIEHGADVDARSIHRDYQRHVTAEGRPKSLDSGGFTPLLYAARENCMPSAPPAMSFRVLVTASSGSNLAKLYPSPSCAEPPRMSDTTEGFAGSETGSAPPIS
jgi:ankyrin repeat protein